MRQPQLSITGFLANSSPLTAAPANGQGEKVWLTTSEMASLKPRTSSAQPMEASAVIDRSGVYVDAECASTGAALDALRDRLERETVDNITRRRAEQRAAHDAKVGTRAKRARRERASSRFNAWFAGVLLSVLLVGGACFAPLAARNLAPQVERSLAGLPGAVSSEFNSAHNSIAESFDSEVSTIRAWVHSIVGNGMEEEVEAAHETPQAVSEIQAKYEAEGGMR